MLIIKWIVRGIGLILIVMLVAGLVTFFMRPGELPDSSRAPWAIQTYSNDEHRIPSRIYYAESVETIDGTPVITNYWTYDGKNYKRHKGEKSFPLDQYGTIDIVRRTKQ